MGGDKWWYPTASGVVGGICCVYAGQPFDTVKVRLQTQPAAGSTAAARAFSGPVDCLVKTVRNEGASALYKGSSAALASVVLENAVLFTANAGIKKTFASLGFADARGELSLGHHAMAGGLAGVFSSTAICPAEVVKCNLQVQTARLAHAASTAKSSFSMLHLAGANASVNATPSAVSGASASALTASASASTVSVRGPVAMARAIVRAEGARGLFKGLPSLWARDIPFNFAFLGSYEAFCGVFAWMEGSDRRNLSVVPTLAAGGFAGMVGWSMVFPMDVVKSRMQTGAAGQPVFKVASTIFRQEGVRAFYQGWTAAVARAFPANAALLLGFELSHRLFRMDD